MSKIITVDYSKPLSELIEAGNYDSVNKNITPEHFPLTGNGKVKLEMEYFGPDEVIKPTKDRNAENELERYNFRHARIEELLAYDIETHRDYMSYSKLAALGSKASIGDRSFSPYLRRNPPERGLSLMWRDVGGYSGAILCVRELRPKGQEEIDKKCIESCKEREEPEYGIVKTRICVAQDHTLCRINDSILVVVEEHKWGRERNLRNRGRIESSSAVYVFDLEGKKVAQSDFHTSFKMYLPSGQTENWGKNNFLKIKSFSFETMYVEVKSGYPMGNEYHSTSIKVYPVTT